MKKSKFILCIYFIILILFLSIIITYIKNGIDMHKLNDMYNDIEILEDKINLYYLDNGNLPVINNKIIDFKEYSTNPNDSDIFYEIDLNKLENLKLTYGNGIEGEKDKYIINEQSHTIYYYKGLKVGKWKIYTTKVDYSLIEVEKYQ